MIKRFTNPVYMTIDEAKAKYYPCAVLLARCDIENHAPVGGYVVAVETLRGADYKELSDYEDELNENTAVNGEVFMIMTQKPFDKAFDNG